MPEKVLFDVNVILDVIENRAPHVAHSGPALKLAETGHIKGFITATSVDTLAFLIRRSCSKARTHTILIDLLSILDVAAVDGKIIREAIAAKWDDPEDAIVYFSARTAGCTTIVTRNKPDFKLADNSVTVVHPVDIQK
jgi:predicted nucleic acid-binding protein